MFIFYREHYSAGTDADAKLATFATAPAIRNPLSNLISEVIGTFVLVLAVLMAVEPSLTLAGTAELPNGKIGLGASVRCPSACSFSRSDSR